MPETRPKIVIKFMGKFRPGLDGANWPYHFPGCNPVWENCEFVFDRHERNYDWIVVYDDLPSVAGERATMWVEELGCPRANTMLITTEPSTIKIYGNNFLKQFGHILTSQEPWAVGHHPGAIYRQPGLVWYYAFSKPRGLYDAIKNHIPLDKTGEISAVCSTKQQKHTLHRQRYDFVMGLKARIPEMELFGRGIKYIEDKADALDAFKYHIAIENFCGPHHWTEKLADPFLGACMPVYYGCPNAEDYFPEESFLRVDIKDVDTAAEVLKRAVRDRLYEKNLPYILESRRRVVEEYAPIAQICRLVNEHNNPAATKPAVGETIASRHALRKRSLFQGISFAKEKTYGALRHRFSKDS